MNHRPDLPVYITRIEYTQEHIYLHVHVHVHVLYTHSPVSHNSSSLFMCSAPRPARSTSPASFSVSEHHTKHVHKLFRFSSFHMYDPPSAFLPPRTYRTGRQSRIPHFFFATSLQLFSLASVLYTVNERYRTCANPRSHTFTSCFMINVRKPYLNTLNFKTNILGTRFLSVRTRGLYTSYTSCILQYTHVTQLPFCPCLPPFELQ